MDIYLNCFSKRNHVNQIVTGFIEMQSKDCKVHFINNINNKFKYSNIPLLEVKINNMTLIYDCEDGYPENKEDWMEYYLPKCDYYFKRSFSKKINFNRYFKYKDKILPLGLNFYVTCKKNPYNFKYLSLNEKVRLILKNIVTRDCLYTEQRYKKINENKNGVIFMTRLWEPCSKDPQVNEQRKKINKDRIAIIRALKEKFGADFYGGLENSELARKMAPDLILSKKMTMKKNYLSIMKNAKVGVATTGLHDSIGWKFCEYLVGGVAIVSEKLNYEIPGEFKAGIDGNYLEYSSVKECIENISFLLDVKNNNICEDMVKRNKLYYDKRVSPKSCVMNSLKSIRIIC